MGLRQAIGERTFLLAAGWQRQLRSRERELQARVDDALARIHILDGMLPICSGCKKIRDDTGYWNQIESYISRNSRASFSHGMCPECIQRMYPEYAHQAIEAASAEPARRPKKSG